MSVKKGRFALTQNIIIGWCVWSILAVGFGAYLMKNTNASSAAASNLHDQP